MIFIHGVLHIVAIYNILTILGDIVHICFIAVLFYVDVLKSRVTQLAIRSSVI